MDMEVLPSESSEEIPSASTEPQDNSQKDKRSLIGSTEVPNLSKFICTVCGDHATGFHYGILSCNGCRNFFRRAKLSGIIYRCVKGTGNCSISISRRSICKSCRFDRCMKLGMALREINAVVPVKKKARIDPVASVDDGIVLRSTQTLSIHHLLESYYNSRHSAQNCIKIPMVDESTIRSDWETFAIGEHNATHAQLFMMVELGKRIPGFRDLGIEDQVALLRSAGRKYIWLQLGWESVYSWDSCGDVQLTSGWGAVKLPLKRETLDPIMHERNVSELYACINAGFDKMVIPFKAAEVTEEELICFEALMLLDPNALGLSDTKKVIQIRRNIQSLIMGEQTLNPRLIRNVMDLYHLLPDLDNYSRTGAVFIRDLNFFGPVGKCSKLVNDLFFWN